MRPLFIGIDPGTKTGVAVWESASRSFREVATLPIHRAMERVLALSQEGPGVVVFEDARQRTWFPKERSQAEYRGHLMGAGAAKRDAQIWEDFLTDKGIPSEARKPQAGATKWNADYWAKVTGWTGRTSEHARDAALLVFQR